MAVNRLLDTNIVLYFLGGKLADPLPDGAYYVSVITETSAIAHQAELLTNDDRLVKVPALGTRRLRLHEGTAPRP